jgi:SAM-dependent methyltransferase
MAWLSHRGHYQKQEEEPAPQTRGLVGVHGARHRGHFLGRLLRRGGGLKLRRMTIELAQLRPGEAVLDVGCGAGRLAMLAKERVGATGHVAGIDPSVEAITRARNDAAQRHLSIDFQVGVIEHLAFPDQSFDVVLSSLMMHQLPDDLKRRGLAEIARVLKPEGRLLVLDTRRPESGEHRRHVHIGPWKSGIQDQPVLMQEAGFSQLHTGQIRLRFFPDLGFVLGRKNLAGKEEGNKVCSDSALPSCD